jgi:hypothetical protein
MRLLVVAVTALALEQERAAHATSYVRWLPDMSREEDSLPPSRPSVRLVAIHRAGGERLFYEKVPRAGMPDTLMLLMERSSSADQGYLKMLVRGRDERTLPERLGWRARVVAGALPNLVGIPVPSVGYRREDATPGWCTLYLNWKDWAEEQGDHRDSLHAGIVLTCLDRAGNESEPSDTVWVDSPAR